MIRPSDTLRMLILVTGALVALLILVTGCKKNVKIRSQWTDQQIQVDGNLSDWEGKRTTYFEDQQAVIGLCNDNERLYIHFRTKDLKWAGLIRRTGLALYIDNEGGKEKDFYIKFYDGPPMDIMRPEGAIDSARPDDVISPDMWEPFRFSEGENQKRLVCFVKDRITEMPIAIDGSHGPEAAYDTSWGFYSYEFSIPLRESIVRYYGIDAQAGTTISIGAVWADMSDMRQRMKEPMGDRPGDGMPPGGGMLPGSMPGGGPGGGMPPGGRPKMPEKQEIWFTTTLAQPPGFPQAGDTES